MIFRIVILCISFSIFPISGWAFEIDGFTNNMSKKEVENNLVNWNFDKIDHKGDSILAYDKPDKTSARLYVFSFENNKLVSVQKDFRPNIKGLIMLFDKFSKVYGSPSSYDSGSDLSTAGESKFIAFIWSTKSDTIEMTYTVFESNDQLSVRYRMRNLR